MGQKNPISNSTFSHPSSRYELANRSADLLALAEEVVEMELGPRGKFWGPCPFCGESNFSVSADKQLYYCFACGCGGNAVNFVMKTKRMGAEAAVKHILKTTKSIVGKGE